LADQIDALRRHDLAIVERRTHQEVAIIDQRGLAAVAVADSLGFGAGGERA
jgi:hypothetical protein